MTLPGWPVLAALTEDLPQGLHLREDTHMVYVCSTDRVLATASAAISLEALTRLIRHAESVPPTQGGRS